MHRLDAAGRSILLDCGTVQGGRAVSHERNRTFPFRPRDIDAVLLSHAHIDHCGNLPNLVRQGFRGPVYCTPATRALAGVMLGDAAKIHEEDARYLNRHRDPGQPEVEPLFTGRDLFHTLLRLHAVPYDTPFAAVPGVEAAFVEAGHLLGSAMVHVRAANRSVTFTGDLGRAGLPILRDPAPLPPADLVICESTYGGLTHEPFATTTERLGEVVRRAAEQGGRVIIPAFSVGRTQSVVYELHQLFAAGRLPPVPVFVDSPMAVRATEVFAAHPECFNGAARQLLAAQPELFTGRYVRHVEKVHESVALNSRPGPCVIISASGMCEAGRVLHHLRHAVEDPRNAILIIGFQAEGTLGRRLVERQPEISILGRRQKLKAEVVVLNGLSSHADQHEILHALTPLRPGQPQIRLVHGEPDRAAALAAALAQAGFSDVGIPDRGDVVTLGG
jgi:metallo-beta-lactamase family protein